MQTTKRQIFNKPTAAITSRQLNDDKKRRRTHSTGPKTSSNTRKKIPSLITVNSAEGVTKVGRTWEAGPPLYPRHVRSWIIFYSKITIMGTNRAKWPRLQIGNQLTVQISIRSLKVEGPRAIWRAGWTIKYLTTLEASTLEHLMVPCAIQAAFSRLYRESSERSTGWYSSRGWWVWKAPVKCRTPTWSSSKTTCTSWETACTAKVCRSRCSMKRGRKQRFADSHPLSATYVASSLWKRTVFWVGSCRGKVPRALTKRQTR